MSQQLPSGSPLFGARVRIAREQAGLSQAEFAALLRLDEAALQQIEGGRRGMVPQEKQRLREVTGRDRYFFTDPLLLVGQRESFSWRVLPGTPEEAVGRLEELARGWIGLLRWLYSREGRLQQVREGPALALDRQSDAEQARAMAEKLAFRLGLGPDLAERVQGELGVPVLLVDVDPRGECPEAQGILAGTCHMDDLDIILVNRRRPSTERNLCLAHELFGVLTRDGNEPPRMQAAHSQEEAAGHFAAALLQVDPGPVGEPPPSRGSDGELPGLFSRDFVQLLHAAEEDGWISARRAAEAMGMEGDLRWLAELFLQYGLDSPHPYH